jgi:hypothetical protein
MSVATGSASGSAIADVVDEDRLLFANVTPVLERHSSSDGREPRLARLAGRSVGGGLIMVGNMWDVETETEDIPPCKREFRVESGCVRDPFGEMTVLSFVKYIVCGFDLFFRTPSD